MLGAGEIATAASPANGRRRIGGLWASGTRCSIDQFSRRTLGKLGDGADRTAGVAAVTSAMVGETVWWLFEQALSVFHLLLTLVVQHWPLWNLIGR